MLSFIVSDSARRHADRTALVIDDRRYSYAELGVGVRQYAAALIARGVHPGDKVAMLLPNTEHFPLVYFGTLTAGGVCVPVHALLRAEEIAYVLRDSGAQLLVCAAPLLGEGAKGAELAGIPVVAVMDGGDATVARLDAEAAAATPVEAAVTRTAADAAVILYTSGTTGQPKGAVLTQLNVLMNVDVSLLNSFSIGPEDRVLGCLPLFHTFGQTCAMNVTLRAGGTLVLMPRFDGGSALDLLLRHECTVFMGVPTMYLALLDAVRATGRVPTSLVTALSGGASLPLPVWEAVRDEIGVEVLEGYGLTETSPVATFNQRGLTAKPGTVGPAIWGVEVAIAAAEVEGRIDLLPTGELGEVVIRGHNIMAGYLNKPEATAAVMVDDWFRTGDLGRLDDDGYLSIVDRKKDLVIRGGYNVYPREVEEVLLRHEAIGQVAVIGVPDEVYGEEVVAVVVAAAGHSVDGPGIVAWAKERLAGYKYPRRVVTVEALPLGPSGKVLKRELRAQIAS